MGFSAGDIWNTLERIVRVAVPAGLATLCITVLLLIGFMSGFIALDAFGGYLWDATTTGVFVAIGLIGIGAVTALGTLSSRAITKLWEARARAKKERMQYQRLSENIGMLAREACLLLVFYLQKPSGRFAAPFQNKAFDQLWDMELIERDTSFCGIIVTGYGQGDLFKVSPVIFAKRDDILEPLARALAPYFHGDLFDISVLTKHVNAVLADLRY